MNPPFPALWPAPDRSVERVALAEAIVRAERALARQAARIAAGPRIAAVRYMDTLTVLALLLPWTHAGLAGGWPGLTRDGLQVSGWVASVAPMSVVLRQVVLTAVVAQPDGRARYGLLGVGVVTGGASILVLARLPGQARVEGALIETGGPLAYAVATAAAALLTVAAGYAVAGARPAPDLLAGLAYARPEDVRIRLAGADLAVRRRSADPLPAAGVLGLVVAAAGTQAEWAQSLAVRWLVGIAAVVAVGAAVLRVRRWVLAVVSVVTGGVALLSTLQVVATKDTGFAAANGAWLTIAGAIVTILAGIVVLLARQARRAGRP